MHKGLGAYNSEYALQYSLATIVDKSDSLLVFKCLIKNNYKMLTDTFENSFL